VTKKKFGISMLPAALLATMGIMMSGGPAQAAAWPTISHFSFGGCVTTVSSGATANADYCNSSSWQRWQIEDAPAEVDGFDIFRLRNTHNRRCLTLTAYGMIST
jgi:hypothetical protein